MPETPCKRTISEPSLNLQASPSNLRSAQIPTHTQHAPRCPIIRMMSPLPSLRFGLLVALLTNPLWANAQTAKPVFINGEAQVVPAFAIASEWIRERLWVETEFDSDRD